MNTEILHETLKRSLQGAIAFPEVVRILTAEGVESYRADLVRWEETFYLPDGTTHVEKIDFPAADIAEDFCASGVVAAIRASQEGKSKYHEFLTRVMNAGTASYAVFLTGKRCIYFGRKGEFHVEEFPQPGK